MSDKSLVQSTIAHSVYLGLCQKIAAGIYPEGTMLPSCRALSEELGVNKNTVSKAVKMLQARNLVRPVPGLGSLVTSSGSLHIAGGTPEVQAALDQVLRMARVAGMAREEAERLIARAVERWYGNSSFESLLVECNKWDASSLAQHIHKQLGISVTPMLVSDFLKNPDGFAERYDVIMTTFYHMSELYSALHPGVRDRVIALQDKPRVDALLAISRLPANMRVGLVAGHDRTLDLMETTLESCGHQAASRAVIDDMRSVRETLRSVDLLLTSERCQSELLAYGPAIPVITMSFEVDAQSMEFLRKKVGDLINLKMARPTP